MPNRCGLGHYRNNYALRAAGVLNQWSRPGLVAGSKSNVSVTLQWSVPRGLDGGSDPAGNMTYRIQRLVVGLSPDWDFHPVVTWLSRQRVRIDGLLPYVTYKVRICTYLLLPHCGSHDGGLCHVPVDWALLEGRMEMKDT